LARSGAEDLKGLECGWPSRWLHQSVNIDIFSDVVCPWCYIGKHRLERALKSYDGEVTVRWHAFQLDPEAPRTPEPLLTSLGRKFGGPERARAITDRTAAVAAEEGLELRFDTAVAANTFDAHRLLWLAGIQGCQAEVAEALFRAYFTEGRNLNDHAELAAIADAAAAMDPDFVTGFLASDRGKEEVRAELATAADLGLTGVPTFIFNRRYAVTGAQDSETLLSVLREVEQRSASDS